MRQKERPDPWLLPGEAFSDPWADPDQAERRACRRERQTEDRHSSLRDGLLGDLLELGIDILFELLD